MGHGGARPGAGRRESTLTTKTRALAEQATKSGLTPLEVMLKAMRAHAEENPPNWDKAAVFAEKAAPYIHPRLAAIEHKSQEAMTVRLIGGRPLLDIANVQPVEPKDK
jgi:hypothetical protein